MTLLGTIRRRRRIGLLLSAALLCLAALASSAVGTRSLSPATVYDAAVFWQGLPFLMIGSVLAVAAAPGLNLLTLGDEMARGLGVHIGRSRALGLAAIVLLRGAATAAVGPIVFLGLIVPHLARMITGPDFRWLIPCSGLLGGLLLLVADIAGRVVNRPGELEVGVMLAAIGAPFFIAYVRRRKLVSL